MQQSSLLLKKLQELDAKETAIYGTMAKKTSTAILLALFFGGLGIQWFYLGKTLLGFLSIVFFWTLIPATISLLFIFFSKMVVTNHNLQIIDQILAQR